MMTRLLCAICISLTVGAGAFAATSRDQTDKPMMKDGQMTVSGCVMAGTGAGEFMLTNAMMMGKMMDKEMTGKDKMSKPAMSGGEHMMSYQLVGGSNLKAHMGHKIEVMGTMAKADMDMAAKKDTMSKTDKDKMMADKDMKAMKLTVSSFKMISATCP